VPWWLIGLFTVGGFLLFGYGFTVAMQARERVRSAQVGLVGLVGEARSDINPEGGVEVKGALWRARSGNGSIPRGTRVRVRGIDGSSCESSRSPSRTNSPPRVCASLRLARRRYPGGSDEAPCMHPGDDRVTESQSGRARVLAVDDDPDLLLLLRSTVEGTATR
jgi:hypothetical protein